MPRLSFSARPGGPARHGNGHSQGCAHADGGTNNSADNGETRPSLRPRRRGDEGAERVAALATFVVPPQAGGRLAVTVAALPLTAPRPRRRGTNFRAAVKIKGKAEHRLGEVLAQTVNH